MPWLEGVATHHSLDTVPGSSNNHSWLSHLPILEKSCVQLVSKKTIPLEKKEEEAEKEEEEEEEKEDMVKFDEEVWPSPYLCPKGKSQYGSSHLSN